MLPTGRGIIPAAPASRNQTPTESGVSVNSGRYALRQRLIFAGIRPLDHDSDEVLCARWPQHQTPSARQHGLHASTLRQRSLAGIQSKSSGDRDVNERLG